MSDAIPSTVTALLIEGSRCDADAIRRVLPLVYDEPLALARRHRARWRDAGTPGTVSLVHEAYDRLAALRDVEWKNRAQFFFLSSRAMRSILIDHGRSRARVKRGGGRPLEQFGDDAPGDDDAEELLAIDDALKRLGDGDPRLARIVECRVFGGLTIDEAGEALGLSPASGGGSSDRAAQPSSAQYTRWGYMKDVLPDPDGA